jgi:hypothetical protein
MAVLTIPGVASVHARSLATQFLLQIGPFAGRLMRREASRVSFLMCPFCVRAVLRTLTTNAVKSRTSAHRDRWGASLEMEAELTQFHDCCFAPTDGVGGEREREGHPVLLPERLTVAQHVVVAGR